MSLLRFTTLYGPPLTDIDGELFLLFSRPVPTGNLGFISPTANQLTIPVGSREYEVRQAPGVLSSERKGGTTGAVVWKVTPRVAGWLRGREEGEGKKGKERRRRKGKKSKERKREGEEEEEGEVAGRVENNGRNPFAGFLGTRGRPEGCIVELGCGISPILACELAPLVTAYILTDQPYVVKTLRTNVFSNLSSSSISSSLSSLTTITSGFQVGNISFAPLDWEQDIPTRSLLNGSSPTGILACDCIYNSALVRPFVETCTALCRLRREETSDAGADADEEDEKQDTVVVVAQQLRDEGVFEEWLRVFSGAFWTWRVSDNKVSEGLRVEDGFVVHVGILK